MGCPLIFAGRGIPKGGSTQAFSYLLDIFPTVCSLTGIQAPTGVEGKNLQLAEFLTKLGFEPSIQVMELDPTGWDE